MRLAPTHLNAQHVLAFLGRHGVPRSRAGTLARRWEALAHRWLSD